MKINKKILEQVVSRIIKENLLNEEEKKGSWPAKPPKTVPVGQDTGPKPEDVINIFNNLAKMGPPQDAAKELNQIGGPEVLAKNYEGLKKRFANAAKNPARIKMPVVDPEKDLEDLEGRINKGALDLKKPFVKMDVKGDKKAAANRKDEALLRRITQLVIKEMKIVKEEEEEEMDIDTIHPQGLDKMPQQVRDDYLTKGLRDGSKTDDQGVTMAPDIVTVGESLPTQSQVYVDKSLWNVLNFTGTAPGEEAFAKKNDIIAIEHEGQAYILDGHHRWSAAYLSGGPTAKLKVNLIRGLDIAPAIAALRSYGNARGNKQKA